MAIGKFLHQIWLGREIPPREKEWCAHWKSLNRGWSYQLWGDAECERYAADPYVRYMRETGESTAFIVDRLRVLILRDHGGFYADCDAMPVRPLDTLKFWDMSHVEFVAGIRSPDRQHVSLHRGITFLDNTFLASAKNGRMVERLCAIYRPEAKRQNGAAHGREILRHLDFNTVLLGPRYFYAEREFPETIALHDSFNLSSWVSKPELARARQLTPV